MGKAVSVGGRALLAVTAAAFAAGCNLLADLSQFDNAVEGDSDSSSPVTDGALPVLGDDAMPVVSEDATPFVSYDDAFSYDAPSPTREEASDGTTQDPPDPPPDAGAADGPADTGADVPDSEDAAGNGFDSGEGGTSAPQDAAVPKWCAAHVSSSTFDCHDFDEGKAPSSGFSSNYFSTPFASLTSADYAPGSPPSSLLLTTPSLAAGASGALEQFNDIVPSHGKLELSFAVKIVNYDTSAADVSLFRLSYQASGWVISLDYYGNTANLNEISTLSDGGTYMGKYPATTPAQFDTWNTVDVLVDFNGHTISLDYNGVASVTNQSITNPTENNPTLFVQTALNFLASPAKPMTMYFDDIVISTPP
jgi:hypothetical protein